MIKITQVDASGKNVVLTVRYTDDSTTKTVNFTNEKLQEKYEELGETVGSSLSVYELKQVLYKLIEDKKESWSALETSNPYENQIEVDLETLLITNSVDTTTTLDASPHQLKCSFYENYFYVFWCDGSHLYYQSSEDGDSWGSSVQVDLSGESVFWQLDFDVYLDDEIVKLTYVDSSGSPTYKVRYVEGEMVEGKIQWGTVYDVVSGDTDTPSVTVDIDGYPWVAYRDGTGASVKKGSSRDGSGWGAETSLFSASEQDVSVILLRQNKGKIYAIYRKGNSFTLFGKLYDGSSWRSEVTAIDSTDAETRFDEYTAIVDEDTWDIHLVSCDDGVHLVYASYDSSADSWGSASEIDPASGNRLGGFLFDRDDVLQLWFFHSDTVYYMEYSGGSWGSATLLQEQSNLTALNIIRGKEDFMLGYYVYGSSSPYDITSFVI